MKLRPHLQVLAMLLWALLTLSCHAQDGERTEGGATSTNAPHKGDTGTVSEIAFDNVRCGVVDQAGNLWFGTTGGGVFRYDGNAFIHYSTKNGLINDIVYSILEDRSGDLWFGTSEGVSRYDGKSFTSVVIPTNVDVTYPMGPEDSGAYTRMVTSLLQDKAGRMWFGTMGGGAYRYDGSNLTNYSEKHGLFNAVQAMLQDSTGNIWFASWDHGGLARYDGRSFTKYGPKDGLSDDMIFCITQDRTGNLWFGTRDAGVMRYDGNSFAKISKEDGLCNDNVSSIIEDRKGNFWYTSGRGAVCRYDGKSYYDLTKKDGLCHYAVWFGLEDRTGALWFGSRESGLCRYDGTTFTDFTDRLLKVQ